jgi:hypothetical protein
MFIMFCVRKATFIRVILKSLVICFTSLPHYVKVAHFVVCAWGACVCFVFVVVIVVFRLGLCYTRYFVVCFQWCFFFVCFDLLATGYVCKRFSR